MAKKKKKTFTSSQRAHLRAKSVAGSALTQEQRDQRIDRIKAYYAGGNGATLEEIGELVGLTRERVRQLLRRAGVLGTSKGVATRNVTGLMEAVRNPKNRSFHMIAEEARLHPDGARAALEELGYEDAVARLVQWRVRRHKINNLQERAERYIAKLQAMYRDLGVPIGMPQLLEHGPKYGVHQSVLRILFGNLTDAQRAAGLPRVPRGKLSHKGPWKARTHCRSGRHEFTPENTRWVIARDGTRSRQCGVCARERERNYKRPRA